MIDPADHLGLAWQWAHKAARAFRETPEEHVGDCYIVVCRCAKGFDPERGVRFSTYATEALKNWLMSEKERRRVARSPRGKRQIRTVDLDGAPEPTIDRHPGAALHAKELWAEAVALARLTDRELSVLRGRTEGETLADIGAGLGVTRERVRQIVERARWKAAELAQDAKSGWTEQATR